MFQMERVAWMLTVETSLIHLPSESILSMIDEHENLERQHDCEVREQNLPRRPGIYNKACDQLNHIITESEN